MKYLAVMLVVLMGTLVGCTHPFEQTQSIGFYPVINLNVQTDNQQISQQRLGDDDREARLQSSIREAELRRDVERLKARVEATETATTRRPEKESQQRKNSCVVIEVDR